MALSGITLARSAGTTAAVVARIRWVPADFLPVDVGGVGVHVHAAGRAMRVLIAQPTELLCRDSLPREADPPFQDPPLADGEAAEKTVAAALRALLALERRDDPGRDAADHRVRVEGWWLAVW